jgi:hypothetical protein
MHALLYIHTERMKKRINLLDYESKKQASYKWIRKMNICSLLGTNKFRSDSWWELVELNSQQNMKKEFINYLCHDFSPSIFMESLCS